MLLSGGHQPEEMNRELQQTYATIETRCCVCVCIIFWNEYTVKWAHRTSAKFDSGLEQP